MPKILIKEGPNRGAQVDVDGKTATIGRSPQCEVFLPDGTVSRQHARMLLKEEDWFLSDLKSRNGTLLNGHAVDEEELCHMDEIRVGDCILTYLADEVAMNDEDAVGDLSVTQTIEVPKSEDVIQPRAPKADQAELARQNERLAALLRLNNAAAKVKNLPELFDKVSGQLRQSLEPDRVVPFVQETDGSLTPYARAHNAVERRLLRQSLSNSIIEHCRSKAVGVLSQATSADERFSGAPSVGRNRISTALCAPMQIAGRLLGVLYLDRLGECESFAKPDLEFLTAFAQQAAIAVENIRAYERMEAENRALEREVKGQFSIVGNDAKIVHVFDTITRAAPTDASVLVTGQSGTGKELVARAIHYNSRRRSGPFEIVNCAALTPTLIESELFGHVKGAFTGAVSDHPGHFELASGGSIFLDEIGELPEHSQSKLLRVLEDSTVRRVGDVRDRKIDVRIIAATNRNLSELVAERKFREDLYFRLNILRIDLPPLRDRGEDVKILAEHFLAQMSARCGRRFEGFSKDVIGLFQSYSWPGNVRELKNVIERMVILGEGPVVELSDVPMEIREGTGTVADQRPAAAATPVCSLKELEQDHIQRMLEHTKGNKSRAAEILGIDRSTLYEKLRSIESGKDKDADSRK